MDPDSAECLEYLQKKLNDLQSNQSSLQKKLKDEDYQQLTLNEKIKYISGQISATETNINSLEVEIAAQDVEIKLLAKEIQTKEDSLSIVKQEADVLEDTVNKRITESYKYSFVGPLELFLDSKNIDTILRKTKYILETRQQDKNSLEEYNKKIEEIREEEMVLAENKASLQSKRNEIEEEKANLVSERNNLASQKAEKDRLLAESERREKEYKSQLAAVTTAISEADEYISDLVIKLFNQGALGNGTRVYAGQTVGYQGHTGCSYGSHLHFDIRNSSNVKQNPANYLNGGSVWSPVTSRIYTAPLDGAMLTQGYKSTHLAWDMVSTTRGNQNLEKYTVPTGICSVVDGLIRSYGPTAYLTGEGAPVKAISNGTVYYGVILPSGPNGASYPAKYALVVHDDGNKSFYLHLK